jgi:hypothetical protein
MLIIVYFIIKLQTIIIFIIGYSVLFDIIYQNANFVLIHTNLNESINTDNYYNSKLRRHMSMISVLLAFDV